MIHTLYPNTLYILSGPSGSGKSYLTKKLLEDKKITQDCIINPDTIRLNMLGITPKFDNNGYYEHLNGWTVGNKEAFTVAMHMLELRMKMGLLTFFDSTALNDKTRKDLVNMAKKYNVDSKVIIFDVEKEWSANNLKNRLNRFDVSVLDKQLEKFDRKSYFNYFLFNPIQDRVVLIPNLIETEKLDIVGDTHGLKNETINILNQLGWTITENNELKHNDSNRKILFLGDVIDRGLDGEFILDLVENAVNSKKAYFLLGNHEQKLIKMLQDYYNNNLVEKKSISVTLFFKKFIQLPEKKQRKLYKFLLNSPTNYSLWINKTTGLAVCKNDLLKEDFNEDNIQKFGFAHADISSYNDYVNLPGNLIFGNSTSPISNDYQYEELTKNGYNKHIYIHGHQPLKNKEKEVDEKNTIYNNLYSLDNKCAYSGDIMAMNFERLIYLLKYHNFNPTQEIYKQCTKKVKVDFNFNQYLSTINVEEEIDLSKINEKHKKDKNKNFVINKI